MLVVGLVTSHRFRDRTDHQGDGIDVLVYVVWVAILLVLLRLF